jgi:hypothetical protein
MFKENKDHLQGSILESTNWMSPGIKKKLEKSWAPIFYEHVFCKIDEKPFAALYSDTGRPSFPINILLSLEFIKHLKNYIDDELIDNFNFNYLVNYAVGIRTLGELNLAEKTLYNFRSRVYQYLLQNPEAEDPIFGQFIQLTKVFAQLAGITFEEQRMDTTMFMSNIKKAGRIVLTYDVLCRAVKAIPKNLQSANLQEVLKPEFKTNTIYRTKPSKNSSKLDALLNLCQEAKDIMGSKEALANNDEFRVLTRFLTEQSYIESTTKQLKAKDNKSICSDSLQSAWDEDATYRKKGNKAQSGYVLGIAETCAKENPFQLITDYAVEKNVMGDTDIIQERLPIIKENTNCQELYLDGGFYGEKVIGAAKEQEIDLHFTDLTGKEPKKLSLNEFDIDSKNKTINKCPKGVKPIRTAISNSQSVAHFPLTSCKNCEFKEYCYAKEQKKAYIVRLQLKAIETAKNRKIIKAERKENVSKRAAIEGTNSALKRGHGLEKVQVRGQVKSNMVAGFKILAQNFKRLQNFILNPNPKQKRLGIAIPISC